MKKEENKMTKFAIIILFLFSLFGVIIFQALVHELSHKQDFKDVVINGSICLLNYPSSLWDLEASYDYQYTNKTAEQEVMKYTEYKAYTISFLILIVYFTSSLSFFRLYFL